MDEKLIDAMIDAYEAAPGVRQETAMRAAVAAIRAAGYAIVPTEGPEFEAAVGRMVAECNQIGKEWGAPAPVEPTRDEVEELARCLRAALGVSHD